jgi:hypothetical protein
MQFGQPGSALQRGRQAALNASCARRALLPIAKVVQKRQSRLEPVGIWRMSGLSQDDAVLRLGRFAPVKQNIALRLFIIFAREACPTHDRRLPWTTRTTLARCYAMW